MEKHEKIPIPKEHRQHAKHVLEILLTKLGVGGECTKGSYLVAESSQILSTNNEVPYQTNNSVHVNNLSSLSLQLLALDAGGYFPFVDHMHSCYNQVSAPKSSRELKKKLRIDGLEIMREESARGPLHAYQSCEYNFCHLNSFFHITCTNVTGI